MVMPELADEPAANAAPWLAPTVPSNATTSDPETALAIHFSLLCCKDFIEKCPLVAVCSAVAARVWCLTIP
jgi:hypothetical protein